MPPTGRGGMIQRWPLKRLLSIRYSTEHTSEAAAATVGLSLITILSGFDYATSQIGTKLDGLVDADLCVTSDLCHAPCFERRFCSQYGCNLFSALAVPLSTPALQSNEWSVFWGLNIRPFCGLPVRLAKPCYFRLLEVT